MLIIDVVSNGRRQFILSYPHLRRKWYSIINGTADLEPVLKDEPSVTKRVAGGGNTEQITPSWKRTSTAFRL